MRSIAEIPEIGCAVADGLRIIVKTDGIRGANGIRHMEVSHDNRHSEIHLNDAQIAIGATVHGRPRTRRSWKRTLTATTGTNGLVFYKFEKRGIYHEQF